MSPHAVFKPSADFEKRSGPNQRSTCEFCYQARALYTHKRPALDLDSSGPNPGHVAVAKPRWLNNTVNVDTGCAFGGQLTALRYPEKELVLLLPESRRFESLRRLH